MPRAPTRKPARRPKPPAEPRPTVASEEARRGLAGVTKRLDEWVGFLKSIVWMLAMVAGAFTIGWNFVGKPWAQDLIVTTVQEPIAALKQQIADLQRAIEEGRATDADTKAQLQALVIQLESLQRLAETSQQNQMQILELLQK